MLRFHCIAAGILVCFLTVTQPVFATFEENLGIGEFDEPFPKLYNGEPLADADTQRMALDMKSAACEDLLALPPEVKEAFLVLHMQTQRPGSLSKTIGPDCKYLGEVREIAVISDPSLTISGDRESLYYLEDAHAIIVGHKKKNSIAYGMKYQGEEPVEYFLEHRSAATRSASYARVFASNTALLEPPREALRETASQIIFVSSSSQATQSTPRSVSTSTSSAETTAEPLPPVGTTSSSVGATTTSSEDTTVSTAVETDTTAEGATSSIPDIEPLGPEPQPEQPSSPFGIIVGMVAVFIISATLIVVYLKTRSRPEDSFANQ